jgi:hypothetical protein
MLFAWFYWLASLPRTVSNDRTRQKKDRTRWCHTSSRARAKAMPWLEALLPAASWCQITSREVLEPPKCDQTRPFSTDRTLPCVRSSLAQQQSIHQRTSPLTGRRPCVSCHNYYSSFGWQTNNVSHYPDDQPHPTLSPVTTWPASGQCKTTPPLLQLRHPWSNVLTTKCFTLCTCVRIFSQTFSRVLACICNELEHLVALW